MKATRRDISVNAVHYKPSSDRLKQVAEQETVKEKDEPILKKKQRQDVPLPGMFKGHRPAFLEMQEEFESIWNKHPGTINVAEHRIAFLN